MTIPSAAAATIFNNHRKWLQHTWPHYQAAAHRQLGLMYLADPRFTAYYDDRAGLGAAARLNEIIQHYTEE